MPTLLMEGMKYNINQGITYALPARLVIVESTAGLETSINGSSWTGLTSGSQTGALFLRCPGGNATVVCKRVPKASL